MAATTMNTEQARFNMIEQQIRPWEVLDPSVLSLLSVVRREAYVPEAQRDLAFADVELPLGYGQSMLAPRVEARILQELAIKNTDKVLEIGTGSGYMAALLAAKAEFVYSVEIVPELVEFARANLTGYKHPRIVEFRKELPKTNVGKILRRELRDEELKKIPSWAEICRQREEAARRAREDR